MDKAKVIRIFISSPGDVAEERDRARRVIEGLGKRYNGRLKLLPMLWEDLPLQADTSFQSGIDRVIAEESAVDIAIFILWSRLGSPFQPTLLRKNGEPYRSGTEREYDLMMEARKQSGGERPAILFYTRDDKVSFDEKLKGRRTEEQAELLRQKELSEQFLSEEFTDAETGQNVKAYHSFRHPPSFSQRLRVHLQELLDPISGIEGGDPVWDVETKGSPFLGLEPFDYEHAMIFFGREDEELEIRQHLKERAREGSAFVLIVGPSGSGKSSLARAGVIPSIVVHEVDEKMPEWIPVMLTPSELGNQMFRNLLEKIFAGFQVDFNLVELESKAQRFRENPVTFFSMELSPLFVSRRGTSRRLLLLLDQIEEFFTGNEEMEAEREVLFRALHFLCQTGDVWIVGTLRSDFYSTALSSEALKELKGAKGSFDLTVPNDASFRRMIEEPARLAGLKWGERNGIPLVNEIMKEIRDKGELLPLVGFVLRELFEQRDENDTLLYESYEKLGGVSGALSQRAENVFTSLSPSAQHQFSLIMRQVTTVPMDRNQDFTRRWADYDHLAITEDNRAFLEAFLDRNSRIFVLRDEVEDRRSVSIAHEALLRAWPRLSDWLIENKTSLKVRETIASDARQWDQNGRKAGYLYPKGSKLNEAEELLENGFLVDNEVQFVVASIAQALRTEFEHTLRSGLNVDEASGDLRQRFPDLWDSVIESFIENSPEQQRIRAIQQVADHPTALTKKLLTKVLVSDASSKLRTACAEALTQIDSPEAYREVWKDGFSFNTLMGAARLLRSSEAKWQKNAFHEELEKLKRFVRFRIWWRSCYLRFKDSPFQIVLQILPAITLAAIGAGIAKLNTALNYTACAERAALGPGIFAGIFAGVVLGGAIVLCITVYRQVFDAEYSARSMCRPFGTIVAGFIGGVIGGTVVSLSIGQVHSPHTLEGIGWRIGEGPIFWRPYLENMRGWAFFITSLGLGVGLGAIDNSLRLSDKMRQFYQETGAMKSLRDLRRAMRRIAFLILPKMWMLFVPLIVTAFGAFALIINPMELLKDVPPTKELFLGGIPQTYEHLNLTEDEEVATINAWNQSPYGTLLGIYGDTFTKFVGGFFMVMGMAISNLLLLKGVVIEPQRNYIQRDESNQNP
tara:strand:+ start:287 stop:3694 length:3408 start_codon:yes stop_codon:yes gene_type:complete